MNEFERKRRNDGLIGFIKEWSPLIAALAVGLATWYQYQNRIDNISQTMSENVPIVKTTEHRMTVVETKMDEFTSSQMRIEKKLDWLIQRDSRGR